MPIYNRFWTNPSTGQHDPNLLAPNGPALPIEISIPDSYVDLLQIASIPIPSPLSGSALIDTGARFTAVDINVLQQLGIDPVSTIEVITPSGREIQGIYMVRIGFVGTSIPPFQPWWVTGSQLQAFGHIALIGRDILNQSLMVYDGKHGMWTIAF